MIAKISALKMSLSVPHAQNYLDKNEKTNFMQKI